MEDDGDTINAMIPGNPDDHNEKEKSCYKKICTFLKAAAIILIFVFAIIGAARSFTSTYTCPSTSQTPEFFEKITGSKGSDIKCIYHTPKSYLADLDDNIDSLCVPRYVPEGYREGMTECENTRTFLKNMCFCDNITQCNIQGKQRYDIFDKLTCFECMHRDYCPCQNNGECKNCTRHHTHMQCNCKDGTSGKFCTKITTRVCHRKPHLNSVKKKLDDCENSNNSTCLLRNYTGDFVCGVLTGNKANYSGFANCSKEKAGKTGQRIGDKKDQRQDEQSQLIKELRIWFCLIAVIPLCFFIMFSLKKLCKIRRFRCPWN